MSNRTWACIDCGKTYRRDQTVESMLCAHCGKQCEYVHWKIRIPSPQNRRKWDAFWRRYTEEKRILSAYQEGAIVGDVELKILGMYLHKPFP